jgi:hypothetical protein
MKLTHYPHFTPIDLGLKDQLEPLFYQVMSGISEFCFAGIYLFRNTYSYQVALLEKDKFVLKGIKEGKTFAALPLGFPEDRGIVKALLESVDYIKGLSEPFADEMRVWLEQHEYEVCEDRDNFDYLYSREELATLSGKRFHKKRNQVNSFLANYPNHRTAWLTNETRDHARQILEEWMVDREDPGDYQASKEALDLQEQLGLEGYLVYVDEKPVAYTMGEAIQGGAMYIIHIEKGLPQYKGIYQYINQAYAEQLPTTVTTINREQDLGDMGLRQAKMTYRPIGFTKKYRVCKAEQVLVPFHTRPCDVHEP